MKYLAVSLMLGGAFMVPAAAQDEIIVTGERRPQAVNDIVGSIALISNEALTSINAEHPAEILNRTSGVFIHRGSGQEHLTAVRSPVLTGGAGAGSFLYLENGVPLRAAGFANVNGLFEAQTTLADRIEVVKGPGGAFYGANAIHGAINVLTPAPDRNQHRAAFSLSEFHRKASFSLARENRGRGFYAGLSLHEDLGFRTDAGADTQGFVFRTTDETGDWANDTILTVTNLNQETAGFATGPDVYRDNRARRFNPNPEAYRDSKAIRLQSTWIKENTRGEWRITPYARWTEMEFLQHFLPSKAIEENGHWSLGLQNAWYGDQGLSLGLDAEYTEGYLTEVQTRPTIFSFVEGVHYDYDVSSLSFSPFFKYEQVIAPTLTLNVAGRGDWTKYDYTNNIEANIVGRFLRPADRKDDFFTFSPKVSLTKTLETGVLQASYAAGARPPQTTDLYRLQRNQDVSGIDPERIDSLELGWRGEMTENLYGSITLFAAKKENFLFRDADGFNVTDGRTRHIGIEADIDYQFADDLSLRAFGTYAEHTYRFDRPVSSTANATEAITRGDDIDTAPRTLGGALINWTPLPAISTELEWVHVGKYYTDASNQHEYPGHDIFNLRAEQQIGFFTGFMSVRNIFDTRHATRADFAFGTERYFPDEGRTLTLGLRFQN